MKKAMLAVSFMVLCAGAVFAAETKIERANCDITLGREFPGAKGTLNADGDGNVIFDYDFANGGRYVGVEIKLPAANMKEFSINFETKEKGMRASLILIQKNGRIETRRKHYGTADKIVINSDTVFTKPGAEVNGSANKVLFRIEKSDNAPAKGTVIFKNITF